MSMENVESTLIKSPRIPSGKFPTLVAYALLTTDVGECGNH